MTAPARPSPPNGLLLAGGTGLVGREVLDLARGDARWQPVVLLSRRAVAVPAGVQLLQVDVTQAHWPELPPCSSACCALGTTIAVAGSQEAFRAVDHDAVLAFARAAQRAGATRMAVVSALGASRSSSTFYNRVKGETEEALTALGFETLVIARPSLLAGDRGSLGQPQRRGERLALAVTRPIAGWIPAAWRPIEARTVARAMLRALDLCGPGRHVQESADLQRWGSSQT